MRAKKSYGQHFLNNEELAALIATSLKLTGHYQKVLEVGPGRGMLTKYLIHQKFELIVVEADSDMVFYLKKNYPSLKGQIIEADFFKNSFRIVF